MGAEQRTEGGLADTAEAAESPRQLALASLCHVLLNANEFVYID